MNTELDITTLQKKIEELKHKNKDLEEKNEDLENKNYQIELALKDLYTKNRKIMDEFEEIMESVFDYNRTQLHKFKYG